MYFRELKNTHNSLSLFYYFVNIFLLRLKYIENCKISIV